MNGLIANPLLATIDWYAVSFYLFAGLACFFGVAVVFTSNVVRMAFYLMVSLGATAGLFILAGAQFVGAMQLMIYVGGTLVLLIFGVMLTAQSRFIDMKTSSGEMVLGGIIGLTLLVLLIRSAFSVPDWHQSSREARDAVVQEKIESTPRLGMALVGVRVDKLDPVEGVPSGSSLRGGQAGYLLPFVIVSMHLLVVLIGAGYMARTKRRVKTRSSVPAA